MVVAPPSTTDVRVNNIFEVIKANVPGSYTAFADKKPCYELLKVGGEQLETVGQRQRGEGGRWGAAPSSSKCPCNRLGPCAQQPSIIPWHA